jgi:hypothetical protein
MKRAGRRNSLTLGLCLRRMRRTEGTACERPLERTPWLCAARSAAHPFPEARKPASRAESHPHTPSSRKPLSAIGRPRVRIPPPLKSSVCRCFGRRLCVVGRPQSPPADPGEGPWGPLEAAETGASSSCGRRVAARPPARGSPARARRASRRAPATRRLDTGKLGLTSPSSPGPRPHSRSRADGEGPCEGVGAPVRL